MSGGYSGGAQTGGNMYGGMNRGQGMQPPLTDLSQWGQAGGNPRPMQPTPMDSAFAPTQGRYGAQVPGQYELLTGDYGQTGGNMLPGMGGADAATPPGGNNSWAPQAMPTAPMRAPESGQFGGAGGIAADPFGATTNPVGGGAMGKMGGGIGGGGWGGYGTGGGSRGQVPFYQWDSNMGRGPMGRGPATPMPTPAPPPVGGPPTAAPPGGPYPGPKAAGGIDHMANLKALMGEDPRLANEYRLRNGDTINWWQQNQGNVAQGLFGGDQAKMQEWLRGTTPTSSNAAPLSQAEMMRLNQMAGIRGPSWMR